MAPEAAQVVGVTRPGRVEVYRTTRSHTRWAACPVPDGCDFLTHAPNGQHLVSLRAPGWSWRFLSNGRIISRCSEAHGRLRDVVRSLELAFPGYRLLDQDCGLEGPAWGLWGHEVNDDTAGYFPLPPGVVLGVGLRGCWIPVSVPPGVSLSSRRKL